MLLEGKVALITGAARGIGKAVAEAILQRQAKGVVIVDILDDVAEDTVKEFAAKYGHSSVIHAHADVRRDDQMKDAFDTTFNQYGGLDVVINNARISVDEDDWKTKQNVIDINLFGVIRGTEMAIERMRMDNNGKGGVIINSSSNMGFQILGMRSVYTASKHAVIGYTRSRGMEIGDSAGIKFRTLCPANVRTEMSRYFAELEQQKDEKILKILEATGGWVEKSEIARGCLRMIERDDLPQDTVLWCRQSGNWLVYPQDMPAKLLD